jgi:hypothetical protein
VSWQYNISLSVKDLLRGNLKHIKMNSTSTASILSFLIDIYGTECSLRQQTVQPQTSLLFYINEVQLTNKSSSTLAGKILDQYHNLFSQAEKTLVHIMLISHYILPPFT